MVIEKDARYQFRLPQSLLDVALEKAKRDDITLAQILRRFLREWVAEDGQPEEKPPDQD